MTAIELQKPLSLGHGQTSLAAALAHRVFENISKQYCLGLVGTGFHPAKPYAKQLSTQYATETTQATPVYKWCCSKTVSRFGIQDSCRMNWPRNSFTSLTNRTPTPIDCRTPAAFGVHRKGWNRHRRNRKTLPTAWPEKAPIWAGRRFQGDYLATWHPRWHSRWRSKATRRENHQPYKSKP